MADFDSIPTLLGLASNANSLGGAQRVAAQKLLAYDGQVFPQDGCAITLSTLLQQAGIPVPDIYQAIALGEYLLEKRNWTRVSVGNQQAGDVGSTCSTLPHHGFDHIYLVLRVLNPDEMVIADNQATQPHFRFASGAGGKTPTQFFLRAPD